ncbi:MAG: hypothetical protein V4489_00990 [Chlamydiota bacterium]
MINKVNNVFKLDTSIQFIPEGFKNPEWDESKDYKEALPCMEKGVLVYTCNMRDFLEKKGKKATFNNEVHYGILEYENSYIAVAYKPKKDSDITAAYAEKVAYDLYERLIAPHTGHHIVPPTIVREMPDGRLSSLHFFVETRDEEDMWNPDFRKTVFATASKDAVQETSIYNAVFNDWDRHPGNYLATQRNGHFYLASIDNESIENKGLLLKWGERSYIPVFFTGDIRAKPQKELKFPEDITLVDFTSILSEHGFQKVPTIKNVFNNLIARGDSNRSLVIGNGIASIAYHQGNSAAFPLPQEPYNPLLIKIYSDLDKATLDECFHPLVQLDPDRFGKRTSEILARRDMFLAASENQ